MNLNQDVFSVKLLVASLAFMLVSASEAPWNSAYETAWKAKFPTLSPTITAKTQGAKTLMESIRAALTAAHAVLSMGGTKQQAQKAATEAAVVMGAGDKANTVAHIAVQQLLTKGPTPVPSTHTPTKSPTSILMVGHIGETWAKMFHTGASSTKVDTTENDQCHGMLGRMLGDMQDWGACKAVTTIEDCVFCLHQHDPHTLLDLYCRASDILSFCGET
jgi:hypothetical protein